MLFSDSPHHDQDGQPTRDPRKYKAGGALLPAGGPKVSIFFLKYSLKLLWFRMAYNPVHQQGLWAGSHGRADWRGSAGGGLVSDRVDHVEQEDLVDDGDAEDDDCNQLLEVIMIRWRLRLGWG